MPEIENNETNVVTENAGMGTNGDFGDNAGGDSTAVNSNSSGLQIEFRYLLGAKKKKERMSNYKILR